MRGLQVTGTEGLESVEYLELPEPSPDSLVIDVRAAGIGFPDLLMARGEHQIRQPVPFTLGWEAAGIVSSAPEGSQFELGDEVVTLSLGSFADRVAAVPEATFRKPAGLSWEEAAAFPMNYLTALAGLDRRGRLKPGETVLVHGAAGGTGTAAIHVANALGARVFAVVSSDAKERTARSAGAAEVFRGDGPWKDEVREASDGGVDLVFDPVGGERFTDSLRSLRSEGRIVVIGFTEGSIPEVKVNRLLMNNTEVSGCSWSVLATAPGGLETAAARLGDMVDAGDVRPMLDQVYEMSRGVEALRAIAERRVSGKGILVPG
ncbi:MAG TPA: NADPH:quinone oxidoreductase family protein [Solirubrobacterales bacterium]|nr:NADPH:quinone oxidoreductase family protein [Solirubrobacterales bacterium]